MFVDKLYNWVSRHKSADKTPKGSAGLEFDLRARADDARKRLEIAADIASAATQIGQMFDHEGYSTGGFTGSVVTASGQKSGPPKMDPVTVSIVDSTGQDLFTIAVTSKNGALDTVVTGATSAVQAQIDRLPPGWTHHSQIIQAVMSALTPEAEIGAAVATVKQGGLVFGDGGVDPATRAALEQDRQQRQQAANDARDRETVEGATVLQASTTVGAPLKLKSPKA
jgi:hypothetical protein